MMKSYRWFALLGVGLTASISLLPSFASASTYRSSNGKTTIVLNESADSSASARSGFYFTETAGRQWMGQINITSVDAGAGHTYYNGTFQDRTMGPGSALTCTGNLRISRQNPGVADRISAQTTWQVTGGSGCPSIGQTFNLVLQEPLPQPDRQGDFNATNSNTWMSETNGEVTWQAWRVVSSDGQLNCRTTPNGSVKQVYTTNSQVQPDTRGGSAFSTQNGSSWMLTRNGCYVRANSRYIRPVSIPF